MSYSSIWLAVSIILFVIEGLTSALVTIWFAVGAIIAYIVAIAGAGITTQIIVFVLSSVVMMYFTKPLAKKLLHNKTERLNSDRIIGEVGEVIETLDHVQGKGLVKVKGQTWSARSIGSTNYEKGTEVLVVRIEGVRVIVDRRK